MDHPYEAAAQRRLDGGCGEVGMATPYQNAKLAATEDRTISDFSAEEWRDVVELTATPGCAGRAERRLADGLLMLGDGGLVRGTVREIGAASGLGRYAVREALERLKRRRLVAAIIQPGRGKRAAVLPVLRGRCHGA